MRLPSPSVLSASNLVILLLISCIVFGKEEDFHSAKILKSPLLMSSAASDPFLVVKECVFLRKQKTNKTKDFATIFSVFFYFVFFFLVWRAVEWSRVEWVGIGIGIGIEGDRVTKIRDFDTLAAIATASPTVPQPEVQWYSQTHGCIG